MATRIEEIAARTNAATEGPWYTTREDMSYLLVVNAGLTMALRTICQIFEDGERNSGIDLIMYAVAQEALKIEAAF